MHGHDIAERRALRGRQRLRPAFEQLAQQVGMLSQRLDERGKLDERIAFDIVHAADDTPARLS